MRERDWEFERKEFGGQIQRLDNRITQLQGPARQFYVLEATSDVLCGWTDELDHLNVSQEDRRWFAAVITDYMSRQGDLLF